MESEANSINDFEDKICRYNKEMELLINNINSFLERGNENSKNIILLLKDTVKEIDSILDRNQY